MSHLFGDLREQQCLPGAGSPVDHQWTRSAPLGRHKILLYVIQGLGLELVECCVAFTERQMLQDLIVQRVGLCVKVLLDRGLDDVHHVLVELFTQTLHVVALHLLRVAQLHVAVGDGGVHTEVGGCDDRGDELIPHLQKAFVGFLVAHDAIAANHNVHVASHLWEFGEAVEVGDLANVADTFPEKGWSLFPKGKV